MVKTLGLQAYARLEISSIEHRQGSSRVVADDDLFLDAGLYLQLSWANYSLASVFSISER